MVKKQASDSQEQLTVLRESIATQAKTIDEQVATIEKMNAAAWCAKRDLGVSDSGLKYWRALAEKRKKDLEDLVPLVSEVLRVLSRYES